MEVCVHAKFRVCGPLSSGRGSIYRGVDVESGDEVAIKVEDASVDEPRVPYEGKLYEALAGGVAIPKIHWCGVEGAYNVLIMDLLGPSLQDIFDVWGPRFDLKTVLMLANQMITRVESIHAKGLVHQDIKPGNFLMGRGKKSSQIYLINFGLAKRYWDQEASRHIPLRSSLPLSGTLRHASINAHRGVEQSRRDDLEAVGYVLVSFIRGGLPWQGSASFCALVKSQIAPEAWCEGLPDEFATYLRYCKGLRYEEKPDYAYLRQLMMKVYARESSRCEFRAQLSLRDLVAEFSCRVERPSNRSAPDSGEVDDVTGLDSDGGTSRTSTCIDSGSNIDTDTAISVTDVW